MPTPIFFTGFEHGQLQTGANRMFDAGALTGASIVTSGIRNGARALRFTNAGGAGAVHIDATVAATKTVWMVAFAVRLISNTGDVAACATIQSNAADDFLFGIHGGKWAIQIGDGSFASAIDGPTIVANQWYWVELFGDLHANPWTLDWYLDGFYMGRLTKANAASTINGGQLGSSISRTATIEYDDWIISETAADFPIGNIRVLSLSPDNDGTHSPGTPDCIQDSSSVLISGSNKAFQYLDDVPLPTATPSTDLVKQVTAGAHSGHYVEVTFPDVTGTILGAMGLCETHGAAATAQTWTVRLVGTGTGTNDIHSGAQSSSSSIYERKLCAVPSGGWSAAAVNEIVGRLGFASDVSPVPNCSGLMIEYAQPVRAYPFRGRMQRYAHLIGR